jgi:hypothetical protein
VGVGLASAICPCTSARWPQVASGACCEFQPVCHHLRTAGGLFCQLPDPRR